MILVSNNRYRLGRAIGSGTRPRIDDGLLGVTVLGAQPASGGGRRPWREWTAAAFEVEADDPVPTGIDGETRSLDPPLRFRIHPAADQAGLLQNPELATQRMKRVLATRGIEN